MLRVVSIWWVVLGHTFSTFRELAPVDVKIYGDLIRAPSMIMLLNACLSVDTFFYLSSFLVSYMMFVDPRAAKKFSYLKYVAFRYLRLTPAMMIVMCTWWILYPVIGAGNIYGGSPTWYKRVEGIQGTCPQYWWTHLLYISNLYPYVIREQCDVTFWYLSADFQLYLIAPLFILPLMSTRKIVQ